MLKPLTEYLSELTKQANSSDLLQFPLLNGILKRASEIQHDHMLRAQDAPAIIEQKEKLRQNPSYSNYPAKPLFAPKDREIDNRAYAQALIPGCWTSGRLTSRESKTTLSFLSRRKRICCLTSIRLAGGHIMEELLISGLFSLPMKGLLSMVVIYTRHRPSHPTR